MEVERENYKEEENSRQEKYEKDKNTTI